MINWSKTNIMYITNRHLVIPKKFKYMETQIEVFDQFKLLGVIIDNKLKFSQHVSAIRKQVYSKLYSIKRLFYLYNLVKLQFFLILPHFDNCISLTMSYSKILIQKLSNLYCICLYKLFKIKPQHE